MCLVFLISRFLSSRQHTDTDRYLVPPQDVTHIVDLLEGIIAILFIKGMLVG